MQVILTISLLSLWQAKAVAISPPYTAKLPVLQTDRMIDVPLFLEQLLKAKLAFSLPIS